MLTNIHYSLEKMNGGSSRRRYSKKIAATEEELAIKLQMTEAAILPFRSIVFTVLW